jgi:protease-4
VLALALLMMVGTGCGLPSFLVTPVSNTNELREDVVQPGKGWRQKDKVVVIEVEGLLMNMKQGGFMQATENDVSLFVQQLDKAEADKDVKAIVLRVNSPGGTVSASDTLYQRLLRFREKSKKPVVTSAQDVMASGGYYVALASDKIVVQPTSVVGSIGVIFNTFEFSGTLAKIGASTEAIKSGPLKDMGSPFKPLTEPERVVMQGIVDEYFHRFRDLVSARRGLSGERLGLVTDGRVFSGQSAVTLGLADQAGFLEDAIELAKTTANSPNAKVVLYRRPYGYGGSIYARSSAGEPQAQQRQQTNFVINLPPSKAFLPTGFYYLWEP